MALKATPKLDSYSKATVGLNLKEKDEKDKCDH